MHDMRIPEMLAEMESKVVDHSSQVSWDETYRIHMINKEVKSIARWLEHLYLSRDQMSPRQRAQFEKAMERVLFYLLYFERLRKYLEGDSTPEEIMRADLFSCTAHKDWVKAQRAAMRQMGEYMQGRGESESNTEEFGGTGGDRFRDKKY
jgi:hypothetical protein